jgi:lipoprotein-releasing system permease protein
MKSFERYIAQRIHTEGKKGFSTPITKLSIISIGLGLAVMIISVAILGGFQKAVRNNVAGFHSDIQVSNFDFNQSYELPPIDADLGQMKLIMDEKEVQNANPFAYKGGILKVEGLIHGVVLKGVDKRYSWKRFNDWIIKGDTLDLTGKKRSRDILISQHISNKLHLDTGDQVIMYFIQEPPRIDKFTVKGVYHSGFTEFDSRFIIGDIRKIQKLNKWNEDQAAGIEICLKKDADADQVKRNLQKKLDYSLKIKTIQDRYPFIMEWLGLLDTNIYFILGLMVLISGITMIATLLILILERTTMIGTLKALGANNASIQKVFMYISVNLILKGLLWGNILALGLLALQYFFEFIPLNSESYYVDTVPVAFNWIAIAVLNISTILLISLMLLWPSFIISRIRPVKALRFD